MATLSCHKRNNQFLTFRLLSNTGSFGKAKNKSVKMNGKIDVPDVFSFPKALNTALADKKSVLESEAVESVSALLRFLGRFCSWKKSGGFGAWAPFFNSSDKSIGGYIAACKSYDLGRGR